MLTNVTRNNLEQIVQAAYRLALMRYDVAPVDDIYDGRDPRDDEAILLDTIEEARNVWRQVRRRG